MSATYRYATILRYTTDDPKNDVEEGTHTIKAGKQDGDEYTVLTEEGPKKIELEAVEVYESDTLMTEKEAADFARDQWFDEQEGENAAA